jgi:putative NADH-flavin reductase
MSTSKLTIAVLGATGRTGRIFVDRAIQGGHKITALVRNPRSANLPAQTHVVQGTIDDEEAMGKVVGASSMVVSCLGAKLSRSYGSSGLVGTRGMRNTIPLMRATQVGRVIVVSAFGAGESYGQTSIFFRILIRTLLHGIYADKDAMEPVIRASHLDWTIVRPANLTNRPATGMIEVNPTGTLGLRSRITRSDVAAFLLQVAESNRYICEAPVITNR